MTIAASPRACALDVLQQVLRRGRAFDEAFGGNRELARLIERDRAFVRLLVATVLRRLGQIDGLLDKCIETPLPAGTTAVKDSLRLGVAQLMFLKTPPHAAVDTSVNLVIERGQGGLKGLVNGVLRRIDREGVAMMAKQDAARINTPDWLWDSWVAAYGEPTARKIALANANEPPLDITVKSDPELWAKKLNAAILPTGSLRRPGASQGGGGMITELPGFAEGAWWVQDAAAAIPAKLLGDVAGKHVIDLCAAPGGKTAQLLLRGAKVTAIDSSSGRCDMIAENLKRLKLEAQIIIADAASFRPKEPAPFVLLDAPCSATGAMRRHPDIAWLKTQPDVARLAKLQDRLLDAALGMLAPGGVLVFCTCSLQPEEGPQRIESLLARETSLAREPITPTEVGGLTELITPGGALRTLPCHLGGAESGANAKPGAPTGGMDGFFAARLRRKT